MHSPRQAHSRESERAPDRAEENVRKRNPKKWSEQWGTNMYERVFRDVQFVRTCQRLRCRCWVCERFISIRPTEAATAVDLYDSRTSPLYSVHAGHAREIAGRSRAHATVCIVLFTGLILITSGAHRAEKRKMDPSPLPLELCRSPTHQKGIRLNVHQRKWWGRIKR
jgi:hypothetical protein